MTPPDVNLQESSKSTILRDECSGRSHLKVTRVSIPMATTKGHYPAVQSPSGIHARGCWRRALDLRATGGGYSVQFSYAKKAKGINGGSLS